jgi:hypothetical protein
VDTAVQVKTNNPHANNLSIPVKGTVIEPKATPTPAVADFGNVFKGWTQTLPVTIENTGWGDLVVKGITLVGGTSDLFTLRTLPLLPATLKRGQRLGMEVAFRADAQATFQGGISVETNDPTGNFLQIPLKAVGTTCELACPTPNAAATCTSGACALATCTVDGECDTLKCHAGFCCDRNWYDVDGEWENGCECQVMNDTGPFCADAANLGEMNDNHKSASFTGVLPYTGDVNTVRFASDSHCFLCSGHTIYVTLTSADPTISMCVFLRSGGDCPTDADQNVCSKAVSSGAQGSTFLVKVSRQAGAAPTCTPFTVTVTHT